MLKFPRMCLDMCRQQITMFRVVCPDILKSVFHLTYWHKMLNTKTLVTLEIQSFPVKTTQKFLLGSTAILSSDRRWQGSYAKKFNQIFA